MPEGQLEGRFLLKRTLDGKERLPLEDLTSLVVEFTVAMVVFHVMCYVMKKIRILVVRVMEGEPVRPRMGIQEHHDAEQARRSRTGG